MVKRDVVWQRDLLLMTLESIVDEITSESSKYVNARNLVNEIKERQYEENILDDFFTLAIRCKQRERRSIAELCCNCHSEPARNDMAG